LSKEKFSRKNELEKKEKDENGIASCYVKVVQINFRHPWNKNLKIKL